ncbi:low molecular weight phosphatase family protein [Nocardia mangyaensis]|uniref:arsenate-mycothiol transferase ArsC n=1 Tax=Nocardia mangyaensis TaxID=2213200 RepID=UPI00267546FC|nr:arsenate reductase ArsC [Nocardia mangyaensis]MDO3646089.1 arsenate reductase ArsC [Nocardia mangyaensis]
MSDKPSVLFVCVKNGGKSQMAAGLMRHLAGDRVQVHSAGTRPGAALNELSVAALAEWGIDLAGAAPTPIDPDLLPTIDVVVTLGREARVEPVPGVRIINWDTDEPSERGIDGIERMRLVRDDIHDHVRHLLTELTTAEPSDPTKGHRQ